MEISSELYELYKLHGYCTMDLLEVRFILADIQQVERSRLLCLLDDEGITSLVRRGRITCEGAEVVEAFRSVGRNLLRKKC